MIENTARFINGMAFMFFMYVSYRMLRNKKRARIESILGYTFAFWALLEIKDLLIDYSVIPEETYFIHVLFFIDSWAVAACSFYLLELTSPGWINLRRIGALLSPFILLTALYTITGSPILFTVGIIFFLLYSIVIVFVVAFAARRYNKYVRNNYSYSEHIDISWLKKTTVILAVCLLAWIITSISVTAWGDCIYYLSSILLWFVIVYYSEYQISIPIPENIKGNLMPGKLNEETKPKEIDGQSYNYAFQEALQKVMEEQALYLNPKLTINEVSIAIGTNRTYLSAYFNNEMNITFYDYINNLRIEKASKKLLSAYPYTMNIDEIAERSGFNSTSTFRRAFLKNTGMTPLQYRKSIQE